MRYEGSGWMATARSSCLTGQAIIIGSYVIKDSTIQSKAKQNPRARARLPACGDSPTVGLFTWQWGMSCYSLDHSGTFFQRGFTDSLCSNGICGHCLSCMKNLHSGDWFFCVTATYWDWNNRVVQTFWLLSLLFLPLSLSMEHELSWMANPSCRI